ncbi:MAG: oxidoreductase, partial [Acetobacteraceae bacterium]|nr:oxidoreductase [Acetobacteraceae bacterium]
MSLWQQAWVGLDCGNPQSADALFARAPPSLGLPNARAVCALRTGDPQAALAFLTLVVDCHGAEILLVGRPNGLSRHARLGWGGGYAKHLVAPRRPPTINFNFLSSPIDAELTVRATRIARAIMTAPALAPMQVTEIAPGA